MKTNQFIKEIKSMGFRVNDFKKSIFIVDNNDFFVAKVSKVSVGVVSTDYPGFTNLEYGVKLNFLDFLFNYATMPIEDREEEKYYYRLKGIERRIVYLNQERETLNCFIGVNYDTHKFKAQFTKKEFEALPDDVKSHNWEKIKVDREWSEMD